MLSPASHTLSPGLPWLKARFSNRTALPLLLLLPPATLAPLAFASINLPLRGDSTRGDSTALPTPPARPLALDSVLTLEDVSPPPSIHHDVFCCMLELLTMSLSNCGE